MAASAPKVLSITDTKEVLKILEPVATRWKLIGITLNLSTSDMDVIDQECNSIHDKLLKMISNWLKQVYDTKKYGLPTWPALIEAIREKIGGNDPALADEVYRKKVVEIKTHDQQVSLPRKGK